MPFPLAPLLVSGAKMLGSSIASSLIYEGAQRVVQDGLLSPSSDSKHTTSSEVKDGNNLPSVRTGNRTNKPSKPSLSGTNDSKPSSPKPSKNQTAKPSQSITPTKPDNSGLLGSARRMFSVDNMNRAAQLLNGNVSNVVSGLTSTITGRTATETQQSSEQLRQDLSTLTPVTVLPRSSSWNALEQHVKADKKGSVDKVIYTLGYRRFTTNFEIPSKISSAEDKRLIGQFYQSLVVPLLNECGVKSLRSLSVLLKFLREENFAEEVKACLLYEDMYDR